MEKIIEYWPLIIVTIASVCIIAYFIYKFIKLPTKKQLQKVKEWLLFAVTEAEKEFGAGTGQIKLRYVYDKFLTTFPYLTSVVSFDLFSGLVDESLVKFKQILETNNKVQHYVEQNKD